MQLIAWCGRPVLWLMVCANCALIGWGIAQVANGFGSPEPCDPNVLVTRGHPIAIVPGICQREAHIAGNVFYLEPPDHMPFAPGAEDEITKRQRIAPPRTMRDL